MKKETLLSISFDDGYLDTYKYAISYLDKLNLRSTIAIPVKLIGRTCEGRPVLNWRHLKNIKKNGHDIASHGLYHMRQIKQSEITLSKDILQEKLNMKISSFVYPYISKIPNEDIDNIVKKDYSSSRISKNYPVFNKIPIRRPYRIQGFCIMKKHSPSYLEDQIDKAIKNGLWLIEVFHLVGKKNTKSVHRNEPYRFFMHIDDFKRHVDFILSKKIKILTQKEVINRYAHDQKIR